LKLRGTTHRSRVLFRHFHAFLTRSEPTLTSTCSKASPIAAPVGEADTDVDGERQVTALKIG
jgi:hypothetical protein